jgi:exonuclease SbcD
MYGSERMVMLGNDLVLPPALVKDKRFDYAAMGHIHKPQDLNEGNHPPVIYPGSIERVDFGEVNDRKYFIIAEVSKGKTNVEWRELKNIRSFIDISVALESDLGINQTLQSALPTTDEMKDAIIRMVIEYPQEWEALIDEAALRSQTSDAFEFQLVKRSKTEARVRLPEGHTASSLGEAELLDLYWKVTHKDLKKEKKQRLNQLAKTIMDEVKSGE